MEIRKRIALNLGLTILILLLLNLLYRLGFYEKDVQDHSPVLNLVREVPPDADILYVGESSNITYRPDDLDKRPISAFLADHYPDLVVSDLTKPASHSGIYRVLLDRIPREHELQTVVVTLNLRSFNAQWIYSNLETPLQKSMVLIKKRPPLLSRFLLSFKAYDIKSDEERDAQLRAMWRRDELVFPYEFPHKNVLQWNRVMNQDGIMNAEGDRDQEKTKLACHYIKGYAFQIDTLSNPRIKDFNAIVELARERNWNLVFNLMAENTSQAGSLVGEDLLLLMRQNAALLGDYYGRRGVVVVNNLEAVPDEEFIDRDWTTEHYAEKGRKIVASAVASGLCEWYEEDYNEVNYQDQIRTSFFNDCEGKIVWGQMNTLSSDRASSGELSSRTGKGQDFGLTLEYPLKLIPDSLKHSIKVDFRLFQEALDHEAKIVLESNGPDFSYYWNGIRLDGISREVGKWIDFSYVFVLPDSIKSGDYAKIYLYNPSANNIYQDDISIRFSQD